MNKKQKLSDPVGQLKIINSLVKNKWNVWKYKEYINNECYEYKMTEQELIARGYETDYENWLSDNIYCYMIKNLNPHDPVFPKELNLKDFNKICSKWEELAIEAGT
tara:strand:- start:248 stop:565 length:318 start_codon:yes stop_codon:yes gene_type:complete